MRNIEIVGEAAKHLSEQVRQRYSHMPMISAAARGPNRPRPGAEQVPIEPAPATGARCPGRAVHDPVRSASRGGDVYFRNFPSRCTVRPSTWISPPRRRSAIMSQ